MAGPNLAGIGNGGSATNPVVSNLTASSLRVTGLTTGSLASNGSGAISSQTNYYAGYLTGTAYTLTTTTASVVGGTTSPSVTLGAAGTYIIEGGVISEYVAATFAANQTAVYSIARTNNTPATLTNSTTTVELRVLTTLTDNAGTPTLPSILYSTTSSTDIITIQANLSALPSAGSVTVNVGTFITGLRLY